MNRGQDAPRTADSGQDDEGLFIIIQSADDIPQFSSEAEEVEFWDTHALAPHFYRRRGIPPGSLAAQIRDRRAAEREGHSSLSHE